MELVLAKIPKRSMYWLYSFGKRRIPILEEVVNTIKAEELVSVLGEDGDWTKIGVDDMEGWVKTEYLLTGEEAAAYMQENGTLYARVTVPNMNIRLRPTTSADILDVYSERNRRFGGV